MAKILCVDRGRSDILFVFMGGGPAQPSFARYAEAIGISRYCRFIGYISDDEISRYLSTTDIGIYPDPKTAWSDKSTMNKILEYMFFGCPIVVFDLQEKRYSAQASAVYMTPNCEAEMADKIASLLADERRRRRMSEYSKTRVRSAFLWENSIPHFLNWHSEVLVFILLVKTETPLENEGRKEV
jgi:glycosyltransferase involved in cell wall biosynthesis